MPRSLLARLLVVLALLVVAGATSGIVMWSLFDQSVAARIGQASAVADQSCAAIRRAYRFYTADWDRGPPDVGDPGLRRDLTAVVGTALNGRDGIEGGLWQAAAGPLAYAFPTYEGSEPKADVPQAEMGRIRAAAAAALAEDRPQVARFDAASQALLIASCTLPGPIPGLAGWTMTRVHGTAGAGYAHLLLGLAILAGTTLSASALVAQLAFTWRRHVKRIEATFARAESGSMPLLALSGERELDRIMQAVNDAGDRLARSQSRARGLERRVAEAERLAVVGRVAAGVAHAIRNPIAAMRLKAESALLGSTERKDRALDLVIGQVDRLDALVHRLLVAAERSPPRPVPTELAPFLDACAAAHAGPAESALQIHCELILARIDPEQMRQALDGLLANAVEAAEGGPVTLRVERAAGRLVFSVTDAGRGPPEEIRATMFEPFVTGHPGRTGLGLSIAREIARAHDGSLAFEREGTTTTFRIEVPWLAS